jgi:hypothetical protein
VRAESIDIKEGTTGGELSGNIFDGSGQSGENFADSWVDIKGNGYLIRNNKGSKVFVHHATYGGFELHGQLTGWGENYTFAGNASDPNRLTPTGSIWRKRASATRSARATRSAERSGVSRTWPPRAAADPHRRPGGPLSPAARECPPPFMGGLFRQSVWNGSSVPADRAARHGHAGRR